MEIEEIDIFVVDGNDKKYMIEIVPQIKYTDLKIKIESSLQRYYFDILYKNRLYTIDNENDILNFEKGDIIYIINKRSNNNQISQINFSTKTNLQNIPKIKLSKILNFFLLKYIAENIDNIQMIESNDIKDIILYLKKNIISIKDRQNNIQFNIMDKEGNNIISYSSYISTIINENELSNLINLLDNNKRNEIEKFRQILSEYENYDKLFENQFLDTLKNSYFEYSLIGISLCEQNNRENYMKGLNECPNKEVKYLFHSKALQDSKKNMEAFNYSKNMNYGAGIYFTDMIDYILFYSGRDSKNKTIPINSTFSCETAEIYYDNQLKEEIYKIKYDINELKDFPTYEELKINHPDKMVKKNGINLIRVDPIIGKVKTAIEISKDNGKGKFIANEYIISEKDQILPLYKLTFKRNEYCIIWRDPNFGKKNYFSSFLDNFKSIIEKDSKMNIYFEKSVENALEIVKKKKYNKLILISSIGLDLSGKRFIEVARKILGFNIVILFFSSNLTHLSWIKDFENVLYTNHSEFCKEYIMNYNEKGLLKLKEKIERYYGIKLRFTKNYFEFPNFINEVEYQKFSINKISENFKIVLIKSLNNNYIKMDAFGRISLTEKLDKEYYSFIWYLTIIGNEITLFSNSFYLTCDTHKKTVKGQEYMQIWKYEKIDENTYLIYFANKKNDKKNILSENQTNLKIKNKNNDFKGQSFVLIDYYKELFDDIN